METAADVGGTRPPAQARPGGPEPREAADARGDQIVHGAPGDPAHRRPVRRLLCCPPGLWPQGCRGCGSSRGGRGRRTCQDEARGAGSEEGRGAVWAGRGEGCGTVTAGGRRQHRGPGRRWSASPGAGGRRSPLPAERARPCGREHAEALVGRDAGGRGSLSTLPSCPRSSELHGPGRRQLRGPLPGNPHPGSTHRLADPGWALCLEVPVEPQTPSCPSQGSEPSHRSHTQPLRLRRVKASSLGGSRPRPSVPLPCRRQTVQFGTGSVDTPDTAFRGGQGRDPIVCPSEGVRPAGSHASRNSVAAARDF